jgi:hypothetical protein
MGVVDTSTSRGRNFCIRTMFGVLDTPLESSNRQERVLTSPRHSLWQSLGPRIPKKRRLGPQNGPGSLEPEKLPKNCQDGKLFLSPWNRWVATDIHLDQVMMVTSRSLKGQRPCGRARSPWV